MNTYPTLTQRLQTNRADLVDHEVSVSQANQLYTRVWQGENQRKLFEVTHIVTSAERSTLRTFYIANQYVPFYFKLNDPNDTQQYECFFADAIDERKIGPGYWQMRVRLETWRALPVETSFLLLESGDYLLQENGDRIGIG